MTKPTKRSFHDIDLNPSASSKKARQDSQPIPPISNHHNELRPSLIPSSPTLIGSAPTSPPSRSVQSTTEPDGADSATSSDITSSESEEDIENTDPESASSSLDGNSDASVVSSSNSISGRAMLPRRNNESTMTSSPEASLGSFTSTSASVSDDISGSSSSFSSSNLEEDNVSQPSSSSGTSSTPHSLYHTSTTLPKLTPTNLSSLQNRLNSLLPRLHCANEQLEKERAAGRLGDHNIENVKGEGEGYIEMDLGLGVLEEKRRRGSVEDGREDGDDSAVEEGSRGGLQKKDAVARLLEKSERKKGRVKIEVDGG